jgi:signal transduction histidine kinase
MYLILLTLIGAGAAGFVGILSLLRNYKSPTHWWLALFILSACLWIIIGNVQTFLPVDLILPSLRATFIASVLMGFAVLYFAKSVTNTAIFTKWLYIDLAILIVAITLSASNLVIDAIVSFDISSLRPLRGIAYPLILILILQFIMRGLFIIERERRKSKGRKRSQLNLISSGLIAGTALAVITNIILPNITGDTSTSRFAFLAVIIWTIMLVYAVVQHRFLDIRLAIVRGVGYIAALITVMALYLLVVVFAISTLLPETARAYNPMQSYDIVVAVVAAMTFQPIRRFFDRITRAIFYRDAYDSQKVLDHVTTSFVHSVDPVNLSRRTLDQLFASIRPSFISIVILPSHGYVHSRVIRIGKGKNKEEELLETLNQHRQSVISEDDMNDLSATTRRQLYKSDVALAARIGTHDNAVGYLFLGHKATGGAFTSQDIDLIHLVADGLAVAIQNALRFEEINNFNKTLQEKVDEATSELRHTNAQLQRLDEAKDEFVSMASHQLRTPLTSVKGYISMVLEGDVGRITAPQRQLLDEAFTSSERMVHLINDFLNVSRLQTGKFIIDLKPIDLAKIAAQEVESLKTTAKAHDLKLRFRPPSYFPVLYLDEGKIRQVLMNFIDNAIYYSREGSVITIELAIIEGDAVLKVSDTGIGVPEDEKAHLFSKFFRASNARKQRPDGTGVGLFLAKKVIIAHGGTMVFESVEGEGSTFGFRLPIKKLSNAPANNADKLKK